MLKTSIKYLGIDFGSSSVSVVGYEDSDKEPILFYDPEMTDTWFATAMTPDAKNFFQRAFFEDRVLDSLKEDIIDGKNDENVKKFMTELFRKISQCRNDSGTYDFSSLERICFGYPTYTPTCTKAYCAKVTEIIRLSCINVFGKTDIEIICAPEPALAAKAYNETNKNVESYKNSIDDGDLILILDLGGYTLDMSILKASKNEDGSVRVRALTNSESIESERMQISMGKRITRDICFQIYKDSTADSLPSFDYGIEEQKCLFFAKGEQNTAPTRLKVTCKREDGTTVTRFKLTKDDEKSSVSAETGEITVGIYSSADGRTIDLGSSYVHCGDLINHYVHISLREERTDKKISHVIFTGGTSRIGELCETIKNKLCSNEYVASGVQMLWVDKTPGDALKLKKANDSDYEQLSSANVVALGAAVAAVSEDGNPENEYVPGVSSDSDRQKCELLRERNAILERMILDFYEKGELCAQCRSEFSKLLEDMEYPC